MSLIGIKLADGSFYPVMEEGKPQQTALNLTTVKDNQTIVQVDLYRSENGTMENAEYIDSLEIKNLIQHPNGQPDFSLDLNLDENNHLEAEINDPETGGHSNTTVTLIKRPPEDRENPTNFELNIPEEQKDNDSSEKNTGLLERAAAIAAAEDTSEKDKTEQNNSEDFPETDFTLPEIDDLDANENSEEKTLQDLDLPDSVSPEIEEQENLSETTLTDNSELTFPDFDDLDFSDIDTPKEENFSAEDFDIPDFSLTEDKKDDFTTDDMLLTEEPALQTELSEENNSFSTSSQPIDFSDLYDKETEKGQSSVQNKENDKGEIKKKTRTPVIICIICAIICILATIFVLFIVPSKKNLIDSQKTETEQQPTNEKTQLPSESQDTEEQGFVEPEEVTPKENEIVVSEPEKVTPKVPEKKQAETPKVTQYKIKWGDTLWDLADAYYRNPWKYKKIAQYNNIDNPDHIISGTYINIPEK